MLNHEVLYMSNVDPLQRYPSDEMTLIHRYPSNQSTTALQRYPLDELTIALQRYPSDQSTTALQRYPSDQSATALQRYPSDEATTAMQIYPSDETTTAVQRYPSDEATTAMQRYPSDELTAAVQRYPSDEVTTAVQRYPSDKATTAAQRYPSDELTTAVQLYPSDELTAAVQRYPSDEATTSTQRYPWDETTTSTQIYPSNETTTPFIPVPQLPPRTLSRTSTEEEETYFTSSNNFYSSQKLSSEWLNSERIDQMFQPTCCCQKLKCAEKFSKTWQRQLHCRFWNSVNFNNRRLWIFNRIARLKNNKHLPPQTKNIPRKWFMPNSAGKLKQVCRLFFLRTVTYRWDIILHSVFRDTRLLSNNILPNSPKNVLQNISRNVLPIASKNSFQNLSKNMHSDSSCDLPPHSPRNVNLTHSPQNVFHSNSPKNILPPNSPKNILPPNSPKNILHSNSPKNSYLPNSHKNRISSNFPRNILSPNSPSSILPSNSFQNILHPSSSNNVLPYVFSNNLPPHSLRNICPSHSSRNIHPLYSSRNVIPPHSPKSVHPPHSSRNVHPSHSPRNVQPSYSPKSVRPPHSSRNVQPSHSPRNVHPSYHSSFKNRNYRTERILRRRIFMYIKSFLKKHHFPIKNSKGILKHFHDYNLVKRSFHSFTAVYPHQTVPYKMFHKIFCIVFALFSFDCTYLTDMPHVLLLNQAYQSWDLLNIKQMDSSLGTEKPHLNTEKHHLSIEKSCLTIEESFSNTVKLHLTTGKPYLEKEKLHLNSEKPHLDTEKPHLTIEKSHLTTEKPQLDTEKPQLDTEKPQLDTEKPQLDTEKPQLDTEKPHLTIEKPHLTTEKPQMDTEKPQLDTEKPQLDTEKPQLDTEKPPQEANTKFALCYNVNKKRTMAGIHKKTDTMTRRHKRNGIVGNRHKRKDTAVARVEDIYREHGQGRKESENVVLHLDVDDDDIVITKNASGSDTEDDDVTVKKDSVVKCDHDITKNVSRSDTEDDDDVVVKKDSVVKCDHDVTKNVSGSDTEDDDDVAAKEGSAVTPKHVIAKNGSDTEDDDVAAKKDSVVKCDHVITKNASDSDTEDDEVAAKKDSAVKCEPYRQATPTSDLHSKRQLEVGHVKEEHPILTHCLCKRQCLTKLSERRRQEIYKSFQKSEDAMQQEVWIRKHIYRLGRKQRRVPEKKQESMRRFFLTDESDHLVVVCDVFFQRTLGITDNSILDDLSDSPTRDTTSSSSNQIGQEKQEKKMKASYRPTTDTYSSSSNQIGKDKKVKKMDVFDSPTRGTTSSSSNQIGHEKEAKKMKASYSPTISTTSCSSNQIAQKKEAKTMKEDIEQYINNYIVSIKSLKKNLDKKQPEVYSERKSVRQLHKKYLDSHPDCLISYGRFREIYLTINKASLEEQAGIGHKECGQFDLTIPDRHSPRRKSPRTCSTFLLRNDERNECEKSERRRSTRVTRMQGSMAEESLLELGDESCIVSTNTSILKNQYRNSLSCPAAELNPRLKYSRQQASKKSKTLAQSDHVINQHLVACLQDGMAEDSLPELGNESCTVPNNTSILKNHDCSTVELNPHLTYSRQQASKNSQKLAPSENVINQHQVACLQDSKHSIQIHSDPSVTKCEQSPDYKVGSSNTKHKKYVENTRNIISKYRRRKKSKECVEDTKDAHLSKLRSQTKLKQNSKRRSKFGSKHPILPSRNCNCSKCIDNIPEERQNMNKKCVKDIEDAHLSTLRNQIKLKQNSKRHSKFSSLKNKQKHPLLPSCNCSRRKCIDNIPEERRKKIHEHFWNLKSYRDRKRWLMKYVEKQIRMVKVLSLFPQRKNESKIYFLPHDDDDGGHVVEVCRLFFIHTLGFRWDSVVDAAVRDKTQSTVAAHQITIHLKKPGRELPDYIVESVKHYLKSVQNLNIYNSETARSKQDEGSNKAMNEELPKLKVKDLFKGWKVKYTSLKFNLGYHSFRRIFRSVVDPVVNVNKEVEGHKHDEIISDTDSLLDDDNDDNSSDDTSSSSLIPTETVYTRNRFLNESITSTCDIETIHSDARPSLREIIEDNPSNELSFFSNSETLKVKHNVYSDQHDDDGGNPDCSNQSTIIAEDGNDCTIDGGRGNVKDGDNCFPDVGSRNFKYDDDCVPDVGRGNFKYDDDCVPDVGRGNFKYDDDCVPDGKSHIFKDGDDCILDGGRGNFNGRGNFKDDNDCVPDGESRNFKNGDDCFPDGKSCSGKDDNDCVPDGESRNFKDDNDCVPDGKSCSGKDDNDCVPDGESCSGKDDNDCVPDGESCSGKDDNGCILDVGSGYFKYETNNTSYDKQQSYTNNNNKYKKHRSISMRNDRSNYPVLAPCKCRKRKCAEKFTEEQRQKINDIFWNLDGYNERKQWILEHIKRADIKRRVVYSQGTPRKLESRWYYLPDDNKHRIDVCKSFFLRTLGYRWDSVIDTIGKTTPKGEKWVVPDKRGKKSPPHKISEEAVNSMTLYIENVCHTIQPGNQQKRQIPSKRNRTNTGCVIPYGLTMKQLFEDYKSKHPNHKFGYESFRKIFRQVHAVYLASLPSEIDCNENPEEVCSEMALSVVKECLQSANVDCSSSYQLEESHLIPSAESYTELNHYAPPPPQSSSHHQPMHLQQVSGTASERRSCLYQYCNPSCQSQQMQPLPVIQPVPTVHVPEGGEPSPHNHYNSLDHDPFMKYSHNLYCQPTSMPGHFSQQMTNHFGYSSNINPCTDTTDPATCNRQNQLPPYYIPNHEPLRRQVYQMASQYQTILHQIAGSSRYFNYGTFPSPDAPFQGDLEKQYSYTKQHDLPKDNINTYNITKTSPNYESSTIPTPYHATNYHFNSDTHQGVSVIIPSPYSNKNSFTNEQDKIPCITKDQDINISCSHDFSNKETDAIMSSIPSNSPNKCKNNLPKGKKEKKLRRKSARNYGNHYPMLSPCCCKKKKCMEIFPENDRQRIHDLFWNMKDYNVRKQWMLLHIKRESCKRRRIDQFESFRKQESRWYFFPDADGQQHEVCKDFFLRTLGYKWDSVIDTIRRTTPKGETSTRPDQRGKKAPAHKLSKVILRSVVQYIQSMQQVSQPLIPICAVGDGQFTKGENVAALQISKGTANVSKDTVIISKETTDIIKNTTNDSKDGQISVPYGLTMKDLYEDYKVKHTGHKIGYESFRRIFRTLSKSDTFTWDDRGIDDDILNPDNSEIVDF